MYCVCVAICIMYAHVLRMCTNKHHIRTNIAYVYDLSLVCTCIAYVLRYVFCMYVYCVCVRICIFMYIWSMCNNIRPVRVCIAYV